MIRRRKTKQRETLPVEELHRLMSSTVPADVVAELSEPVCRALLLHLILNARYGE